MKTPVVSQFQESRKQELIRLKVLDPTGKHEVAPNNYPRNIFTFDSQSPMTDRITNANSLWRNIWFENECMCLFGDPGVGKSSLAYQIAEQVADEGREVVYFDFDNIDHQYCAKGKRGINRGLVRNLTIDPDTPFADAVNYRIVLKSIESSFLQAGADIIVIDDISFLCPMRDCERTRRVLQQFRYWMQKYFVSILVIAHARKHPEGLPLTLDHLTGSRQLAYAFDSIITLNKVISPQHTTTSTHYVKQLKARNSRILAHQNAVIAMRWELLTDPKPLFEEGEEIPEPTYLLFQPFYRFCVTSTQAIEKELINIPVDATRDQILEFVHSCDERGWSVRQIAEHTHYSKSTVHLMLSQPATTKTQETAPITVQETCSPEPSPKTTDESVSNPATCEESASTCSDANDENVFLPTTLPSAESSVKFCPIVQNAITPFQPKAIL